MEKGKKDKLIENAAKIIFLYCRARTNSKEEAEDLSQNIIIELLRTKGSFCNDAAFYGFMWAVAGNVYKNWCKKRNKIIECELNENISDESVPFTELLEKESDLMLLYRELGLLTEQYRYVTIQYYFNDLKISEISKSLNISESTVKFLLFKSRKILREGINMERIRGDLSFNPGNISLAILKGGANFKPEDVHSFWNLVNDSLIAQNILLACYNDRCKAEEISLQIGVAVPYLEGDLKKLCEKEFLIQKGGKYETAIVILTKEFSEEAYEKTLPVQCEIAETIGKYLTERLNDIKAVGFYRGADDDNLLKWLVTQIIVGRARAIYQESIEFKATKKYAGIDAIIWGGETWENNPGGSAGVDLYNANGDAMVCIDFFANGAETYDSFYFDRYQNRVNIILEIAKGKSDGFSENDTFEIAEFIKRGYVAKNNDKLNLKFPVFTKEQNEKFMILIEEIIAVIADKMRESVDIATEILIQHTPDSLKKEAENIGTAVCDRAAASIKIMVDNGVLHRVAHNAHPATFVVLA